MEYRYCGRSGLQLPAVSLGLWHNFDDVTPVETQERIIWHAFDSGVTHFDLANNYGPPPGRAEENFGRILANGFRVHRDEIIVSSKAGHRMWPGPYGDMTSRKNTMASIDQSLRRTGLDYFDIFYSHRYCPEIPLEETVQALVDIVRQGKALYVGLSKYPAEVASEACRLLEQQHVKCLVYQDRFNMIDRRPETEHLDLLAEKGIGLVAFSPLAQGLLTDRYLDGIPAGSRVNRKGGFLHHDDITPEWIEKARRLNELAAGRGKTLAQMSLGWVLARGATSVIVGVSSEMQLDDNLKAASGCEFSNEDFEKIDRILGF